MTLPAGYHVRIGSENYVCKIDAKTPFGRESQQPFVNRMSVATSRTEGEYGRDMVFTQRSWNQGEGQSQMTGGSEAMYYTSSDLDVSGSVAGLTLHKTVAECTGGVAPPSFGTGRVLMEPAYNGVMVAYPYLNTTTPLTKYLNWWDGSTWTQQITFDGTTGIDKQNVTMYGLLTVRGYVYVSFSDSIVRSDNWLANWNADGVIYYSLGTDGRSVWGAAVTTNAMGYYTSEMFIFDDAGTSSSCSADLDGAIICIKPHAGTMYALARTDNAELSYLYKMDSSGNYVPFKEFPDGFYAESLRSDGSVLYISGRQKSAEGNYRGQIYYVTGSSSSEALGQIATFGVRDSSSDYSVPDMRAHGKSIYFPWMFYGGLGRYDTVNGGISRSYRQSSLVAEANMIERLCVYKGDIYFVVTGSGANDSKVYKSSSASIKTSGVLDSSFIDFGLPSTQKLYRSVTVTLPEQPSEGDALDVYASYDNNYNTGWELLGTIDDTESDWDEDTNSYIWKKTFDVNTKAHSLAYRLSFTYGDISATYPKVSSVSVNAITLLRSPGKTEPNKMWRFTVVIANNITTENSAKIAAEKSTLLANLRDLEDSQDVTTFEAISDEGATPFNVMIAKVSEVAIAYTKREGWEATAEVEVHEV